MEGQAKGHKIKSLLRKPVLVTAGEDGAGFKTRFNRPGPKLMSAMLQNRNISYVKLEPDPLFTKTNLSNEKTSFSVLVYTVFH